MNTTAHAHESGHDDVLEAVSTAARCLIAQEEGRGRMDHVLEALGVATQVDRVYIFENYVGQDNRLYTRQCHEWCRPHIAPQIDNGDLQCVDLGKSTPTILHHLRKGEIFQDLVANLPEQEREVLEPQGIRSIAIVPVFSEAALWGFLGFDDCTSDRIWRQPELAALRTAADIIGAYYARERWNAALRHSGQQWRTLFEKTQDIMLVIEPGEGEILCANRATLRLLGYTPDFLTGRKLSFLLPEQNGNDWDAVLHASDESSPGVTLPFMRFDGGHCIMDVRTVEITWQAGRAYLATLRDVSEREHTEELLRRNEERFRRIFEQTPVALWERDYSRVGHFLDTLAKRGIEHLDEHFAAHPGDLLWCLRLVRTIDVNQESLPIYRAASKQDLINQQVKVYGPDLSRNLLPELKALRSMNDHTAIECMHYALDGTPLNLLMRWTAIPGDNTDLGHVIISFMDITSLRKAEREARLRTTQLLRTEKMATLGTLVAGIAHEINNPNSFISLNTPLVKEIWQNTRPILEAHFLRNGDFSLGVGNYSSVRDEMPSLLDDILEGSKRIGDIVSDLRDFARHTPTETYTRLDINSVVRSAASLLRNTIAKHTRQFHVHYADRPPFVMGHKQSLERVLINLIMNACQALPDKNSAVNIHIMHHAATGEVTVQIRDQGCGIAEENMKHIKDPFYTTRRETGGTGLGLPVSAKIVEEHRGRLEFESMPGRGTTVNLILPEAARESTEALNRPFSPVSP